MSIKQECANPECRHDKESHYRDPKASKNGIPQFWSCNAIHCDCATYVAPVFKQDPLANHDDD